MNPWNKIFVLIVSGFVLATPLFSAAQSSKNLAENEKLDGKIKSIEFQRTYFIYKGQNVTMAPQLLGMDRLDEKGRLIQTSTFGNGEERTLFNWVNETYTVSVSYFDLDGKPAPKLRSSFEAQTDEMRINDLCADFTIKNEKDLNSNIEREYEICSDKSVRRTTTTEFSSDNHIIKEVVEDSKGRSWETAYKYGINFTLKGFRYTVNNLTKPKYWHEVTYGDTQFDENKNWIRRMTSSTNSKHPEQISYQYIEERKISYYE